MATNCQVLMYCHDVRASRGPRRNSFVVRLRACVLVSWKSSGWIAGSKVLPKPRGCNPWALRVSPVGCNLLRRGKLRSMIESRCVSWNVE
jgi:hypothetical protein